jgi:hypothetical protein
LAVEKVHLKVLQMADHSARYWAGLWVVQWVQQLVVGKAYLTAQ